MSTHNPHPAPEKNSPLSFPAMAMAYCLGVFNDNYFKQAALLLAVSMGLGQLQGWATMLFALPFILFSAHGGWCADRFAKKKVIVTSKALEVVAMLIGGVGLLTLNWPCILAMVFLMGMQSAFFSPALNGSIPELFPVRQVPKVNAILKLVTTLAILAGIATAGLSLDQIWLPPERLPQVGGKALSFGTVLVATVALCVAIFGFLASFGLGIRPAAGGTRSFPWLGPLRSLTDLAELCKDRHFLLAILGDAWFYGLASLVVLLVNVLGLTQFGFSQTRTSLLATMLMLGVCLGSFVAAKLVRIEQWARHLRFSALGMGLGLILTGSCVLVGDSIRFVCLSLALGITGMFGGIFLIPIATLLQIRPAESDKGRVLGASSFLSFVAILATGLLFSLMDGHAQPSFLLQLLGGVALLVGLALGHLAAGLDADKGPAATPPMSEPMRHLFARMVRALLALRYRVQVDGLEDIAPSRPGQAGILFLPNHPALIDPVILMSHLFPRFAPRPLSDSAQIDKPGIRQLMRPLHPITIPDVQKSGRSGKQGVLEAMRAVVHALEQGDNVLFYPAGRLNRSAMEHIGANSGVAYILQQLPQTRVVLVRSSGLWGSSFSHAPGKPPSLFGNLRTILLALAANLLFFIPKRAVHLELQEGDHIVKQGERQAINAALEAYYNAHVPQNTFVPYFFWQGPARVLAEPGPVAATGGAATDASVAGGATQALIRAKIGEIAGQAVQGNASLAADLGLDSLSVLELATWIETEFGVSIPHPSALETVDDCILAALGQARDGAGEIHQPGSRWFSRAAQVHPLAQDSAQEFAPESAHPGIGELFLRRALATPGAMIAADQLAGERSYRDLLTAILLLQPHIRGIAAERVGIMLPASVSAVIAYFSVLLAGKTPVLFNWTAGRAAMAHGIRETGVSHILSAGPLCRRVEEMQGFDLNSLEVQWLQLDTIFAAGGKLALLRARCATYLGHAFLARRLRENKKIAAVILFTSGSEAQPKSVPLSHANIFANLRDFTGLLQFSPGETLLAMLPPFHSLGLVGTVIMPMLLGLQSVYHPNPTEPALLARLIEAYRTSMLISTPTFLSGILQAARPGVLGSLRTVFTGAEKCPHSLRERLAAVATDAVICEGYGITECSPLVSINTYTHNRAGTIGRVLPSLEYAIVDEAQENRVPQGQQGMLLLRGPSIFAGYLGQDAEMGFCHFAGKQWYVTGDLVREDEAGFLTFCGRRKRFVKIAGEMISLPAIEAIIAEFFAGMDTASGGKQGKMAQESGPACAVCAAGGDGHPELTLFTTRELNLEQVNTRIRAAGLSALHSIRRIVHLDVLPLLGTGKTDYKALERML